MIKIENISKDFKVNKSLPGVKGAIKSLFFNTKQIKRVVDNISFEVNEGEIVGFIGPNGAGKSTTIKILTGILHPSTGNCLINGIVPYEKRLENAKNIGVVFGQRTQLWWDLPLTDTFLMLKKIYEISDEDYQTRYNKLNSFLQLDSFANQTVRTLSLGQRMRADLAASLLHNPKVLYLDEPTIGLDIVVKDKMISALKELQKEFKTTVILTTHDMSDIEKLCDRIIVIDQGKIIYNGDLDEMKQKYYSLGTLEIKLKEIIDEKTIFKINKKSNAICKLSDNKLKLIIEYNKDELDVVNIINVVYEYAKIQDIIIKDVDINDVVKKIYNS